MHTVIIAEKEYFEKIQEYSLFLDTFVDKTCMDFCEWNPKGTSLEEMVPDLEKIAEKYAEWRALIICDECGLNQKNPFDFVSWSESGSSETDSEESEEVFVVADNEVEGSDTNEEVLKYARKLNALLAKRRKGFMVVGQNPLVRLTTFLCEEPMSPNTNSVGEGSDLTYSIENMSLLAYKEYVQEEAFKSAARKQILNGNSLKVTYPSEIYCVAKRTFNNEQYDIPVSWDNINEREYSDFAVSNLYSDKVRFFVFDLLPKSNVHFLSSYVRFLYTTLLMSKFDMPRGSVQSGIVYNISCDNDEKALSHMLENYDQKLENTVAHIQKQIRQIEDAEKKELTDKEATEMFGATIPVPVTSDSDIDLTELYPNKRPYHLAEDCPVDERDTWSDQYKNSRHTLQLYLKQPRRALKRAATGMRAYTDASNDRVFDLNEFQIEDVQERIGQEEVSMVTTDTAAVFDTKEYDKKLEAAQKRVRTNILSRMEKKPLLILGCVSLGLFIMGFLPLLIRNIRLKSFGVSVLLAVGSTAVVALALLIFLFSSRHKLRVLIGDYNGVMRKIAGEVADALNRFSVYLSHVCNIMRGFSILNYHETGVCESQKRKNVLNKHIADIREQQDLAQEVFGCFIQNDEEQDAPDNKDFYDYDFSINVRYSYDFMHKPISSNVEYMQTDNFIEIPVDFVKSIQLRREELYD